VILGRGLAATRAPDKQEDMTHVWSFAPAKPETRGRSSPEPPRALARRLRFDLNTSSDASEWCDLSDLLLRCRRSLTECPKLPRSCARHRRSRSRGRDRGAAAVSQSATTLASRPADHYRLPRLIVPTTAARDSGAAQPRGGCAAASHHRPGTVRRRRQPRAAPDAAVLNTSIMHRPRAAPVRVRADVVAIRELDLALGTEREALSSKLSNRRALVFDAGLFWAR
jgi:hypothetical protein